MTTETMKRCPKCGETFPVTTDHWFFDWSGKVTGYHRPCHRAYNRDRYDWGKMTDEQREAHRAVARDWYRRTRGVRPENYRGKHRAGIDS